MFEVAQSQAHIQFRTGINDDHALVVNEVGICYRKPVGDRMDLARRLCKTWGCAVVPECSIQSYPPAGAEHFPHGITCVNSVFLASLWYNEYVVWDGESNKVISVQARFRSAIRHPGSNYLTTTVQIYSSVRKCITRIYPARTHVSMLFQQVIGRNEQIKEGEASSMMSNEGYQDRILTCRDCGQDFTFTAGEQEFYDSRGLTNKIGRAHV